MSKFDIVFRNGLVIDGTGSSSYQADVGLKNDKIAEIGNIPLGLGDLELEINERVIAPGFIDAHTHDDRALISSPDMSAKASQGVTTVITGNCGISLAPLRLKNDPPPPLDLIGNRKDYKFTQMNDYLTALEEKPPALNAACLVGHSTLRVGAMDDLTKPANDEEIENMRKSLFAAIEDGAIGLSSGTFYPPAAAAPTSEIALLAEEVGKVGGVYTTHMRDEADHVLESIEESIQISQAGQVALIISHHKVTGKSNHGRTRETLPVILDAIKHGEVGLDVYPYIAASSILLADRAKNSERVRITWSAALPDQAGRDLSDIAREMGVGLDETVARLSPAGAVYFMMDEADVQRVIKFPHTMIGSDGLPHDTHPHPRLWGTFPRVLGHYARDIGLFSLEEGVRRMTSLTADKFRLTNRGRLAPGFYADIVIFDPERIKDTATFENPTKQAAGIDRVYVNGVEVWQAGKPTVNRPGRALRRQELALEKQSQI